MKYTVGEGRLSYSNRYVVYVHDGFGHAYRQEIPLKRRWWHLKSPRQRIIECREKAEKIAEALNHQEMYLEHEIHLAGGDLE